MTTKVYKCSISYKTEEFRCDAYGNNGETYYETHYAELTAVDIRDMINQISKFNGYIDVFVGKLYEVTVKPVVFPSSIFSAWSDKT